MLVKKMKECTQYFVRMMSELFQRQEYFPQVQQIYIIS